MLTSLFADLNDKFFHYKRQTYLFAFPAGIVICILYILGSLENLGLGTYIVIGMIVELGIFIVLLAFWPRYMRVIEYVLYISFSTTFFLLTQISIDTFRLRGDLGPSQLADVLNSLCMWMIVFLMAAYLTTGKTYVRILLAFIFTCMTVMAVNNIWVLSSNGRLEFTFVFRWINAFASLAMTTLLIQRMGVLQQNYASTDQLTGILNRRALYQVLLMEMDRSARYRKPFSLILLDVDHFKLVNDTYGHLAGDKVLKGISALIKNTIREVDSLGRWGGEEFLLLLPETDGEAAKTLAERICQLIRESKFGKVEHVTVSLGVTVFQSGQALEDMLHNADRAMYQAKLNGRDQAFMDFSPTAVLANV